MNKIVATLRDPLALGALVINVIPIYGVFALGWGAATLVFLYWLENLVLGAGALMRMMAASLFGNPSGRGNILLMGPFFVIHFGIFCFGHGSMIVALSDFGSGPAGDESFLSIVNIALQSGRSVALFLGIIAAWHVAVFLIDFIIKGGVRTANIMTEMMAPYGHIVVLHIALLIGGGILLAIGEPLLGTVLLIVLRAVWGIYRDSRRRVGQTPAS